MIRCNHCNKKVIRYPVKGQQEKSLSENYKEGTLKWINLFKVAPEDLIMFGIVLMLLFAYKHDTQACEQAITDPVSFCAESGIDRACANLVSQSQNQFDLKDYINRTETIYNST